MSFQINIDSAEYEKQLGELRAKLTGLENLAAEYARMKNEAQKAWGDEDENLANAQRICDDAIAVVNRKIESVKGSIDAVDQLIKAGDFLQRETTDKLSEAAQNIQALLK